MKRSYIICEINPTGEGADLTFAGPGGSRDSHFSINVGSGIVELELTIDLQEPRVLKCKQEGAPFDLDKRSGRSTNKTKKPGDVVQDHLEGYSRNDGSLS